MNVSLTMLGSIKHIMNYKSITSLNNRVFVRKYTARRALMYVPGDDTRKINKAFDKNIAIDCIALDCEDGVALNKKDIARNTIRNFLDQGKPKKSREYDLAVRINSFDTLFCKEDLTTVLKAKSVPDTILFPKIEDVETIKWFSDNVNNLITQDDTKINLIIFVETARGFINMINICKAAQDLSKTSKFVPTSLVFGSDDFIASIGATRSDETKEIMYARQKIVVVAKAFKLQAIDMVYIKYKDLEGLRIQSEEGMRFGYTGKQVIHPDQVPVVQQAFLPTKSQVEWANGLLSSFEQHQLKGKGAFTYKGEMIDMPTVKQARHIMELVALEEK